MISKKLWFWVPINDIDDKAYLLSSVLTEGDFYEGAGKWGCQLNPPRLQRLYPPKKVFSRRSIIHRKVTILYCWKFTLFKALCHSWADNYPFRIHKANISPLLCKQNSSKNFPFDWLFLQAGWWCTDHVRCRTRVRGNVRSIKDTYTSWIITACKHRYWKTNCL